MKVMEDIDFCTLGMFIIDEIEFEPPRPPVKDIIGGAGSYAVIGARLVAGREASRRVGWIVDAGSDFPPSIGETISAWDTYCVMRETPERLTTRGWNGYGAGEQRAFKYLTPKLRLDHSSLPESLVFSKTFHMVCSGTRCCQLVQGILRRREELLRDRHCSLDAYPRPIFVWEPVPDLCRPDELPDFYAAIKQVDVVSPNDAELAQYFGKEAWDGNDAGDQGIVETIVNAGIGPEGDGTLVIRAGKHGCHAYGRGNKVHLPAYHGLNVVDPTGAGNAFLGAVAEALVCSRQQMLRDIVKSVLGESQTWKELRDTWGAKGKVPLALMCATVAASFVIEQIGMPSISTSEEQGELWNGVTYSDRLQQYARQLKDAIETR